MSDNFFDTKEGEEPTKLKLGEKEYTQDELSSLVGLGETAREYETKWNRKVSEFYPDYTQKSQRLSELEKKEAERAALSDRELAREKVEEEKKLEERAQKNELTPQEQRELAIKQAKELGIVTNDVFEREVTKRVQEAFYAKQIVADTEAAVSEATEKYGIKTSVDDVLRHMNNPANPSNPVKAIKDMFDDHIEKWREEQITKLRPNGMMTQDRSTAGGKAPPPRQPISRDKLSEAIGHSLTRSRGVM